MKPDFFAKLLRLTICVGFLCWLSPFWSAVVIGTPSQTIKGDRPGVGESPEAVLVAEESDCLSDDYALAFHRASCRIAGRLSFSVLYDAGQKLHDGQSALRPVAPIAALSFISYRSSLFPPSDPLLP